MAHQKTKSLEETFAALLARRRERSMLRQLTLVAPETVDFSSNSYLSLSAQPEVHSAYLAFLQDWSAAAAAAAAATAPSGGIYTSPPAPSVAASVPAQSSFLGSGGSRLLDGNSLFAEDLEAFIAAFHGAPAALLFNSGFDANVGLFASVPQPGDVIVYDELIHASVHDGMKLSRAAKKVAFRHNVVFTRGAAAAEAAAEAAKTSEDQDSLAATQSLDAVLRDLTTGPEGESFRSGRKNVFIAVEGVYSMDGDVAPLGDVVASVEAWLPRGNGHIIVDEAHSTGVLGARGRGLVSELGLEDRVFARLHTFGKAMGCSGAAVLCSATTRAYLVNYARTLIYTTAMGLPSLASIRIAYEFMARGDAEPLARHLRHLVEHAYARLQTLCDGTRFGPRGLRLRLADKTPWSRSSPIVPLFTSEPRSLARYCQQMGFMVRPIVAPTVPRGTERVRICLHAANTREQVDGLVAAMKEWVEEQTTAAVGTNKTRDVYAVAGGSLEAKAKL